MLTGPREADFPSRMQAALSSFVRRIVPEPFLLPMWKMRRRYISKVTSEHEWRWWLSSARSLETYVDEHLALGDLYWLFILGLNNSGTTLLFRILESHPLVRSLPKEGHFLTDQLPRGGHYGVRRLWGTRPDVFHWTEEHHGADAMRVKYDWARHYPARRGILLEKSPANSMRARWLQQHFRPARFLAIVRSPYAVCEGIKRRAGSTIEMAARHWSSGNQCLFDDMTKLERHLWFRYEDFCAEPLGHLDRFEEFLGLERGSLDRTKIDGIEVHNMETAPSKLCETEGRTSPLRDFNAKSIARLGKDEIATISRICGAEMERAGYTPL